MKNINNSTKESKLVSLIQERQKAKREPLSVEKVRNTSGLENLSAMEAEEVVSNIKMLAKLLVETACYENLHSIDNQQTVYLNQQNKAA